MAELRQFTDNWAYDISLMLKNKAEIYDEDVINQSIEMILGTAYGERFFNPAFGSSLPYKIFETINESSGEQLIDDIVGQLKRWEDRIVILERQIELKINPDENYIILNIPYIIKRTGKSSKFIKKIIA